MLEMEEVMTPSASAGLRREVGDARCAVRGGCSDVLLVRRILDPCAGALLGMTSSLLGRRRAWVA